MPQISDPDYKTRPVFREADLRRHLINEIKADDKVLFIDASRDFEAGKNQNVLREADLQRILDTAAARQPVARYAHLATPAEIAENDFNLNIPRYVDTFEEEEEIDLDAVKQEITTLEAELGRPPEDIFDWISPTAIAAASIAQVHEARLRTGEEVVVKVQRSTVGQLVGPDLLPSAVAASPPASGTLLLKDILP